LETNRGDGIPAQARWFDDSFEILLSLRHFTAPRIDRAIWPLTAHVDELSRLCVGEVPLTEVADEFGTPTYVIDEADFRHRIRRYRAVLPDVRLVYGGKSLLTTAVAQWVAEEGGRLGVCSGGELATALDAGVDPNQIVMHGSATTFGELCKAASVGVGRIVVNSPLEVAFPDTGVRRPEPVQVRVGGPGGRVTPTAMAALIICRFRVPCGRVRNSGAHDA
jgi:diaminopimelate decarboxylase